MTAEELAVAIRQKAAKLEHLMLELEDDGLNITGGFRATRRAQCETEITEMIDQHLAQARNRWAADAMAKITALSSPPDLQTRAAVEREERELTR